MKLTVLHQESYSRGELLLRFFFGWLYILIPHAFLAFFIGLWAIFLQFVAFWVILFTGRYPESMFRFQMDLLRWDLRLSARVFNISDGYPAMGLKPTEDNTNLEHPYPEKVSRGLTLVRLFFGLFYVLIPHGFVLIFRGLFVGILAFLAWWNVLFTGKYPESAFKWVTGQLRWQYRVILYMNFMSELYPPFRGEELPDES